MTNFERLLRSLVGARVDFIVVGGIAGGLHGAARATYDLDVVYARDTQNLTRLVGALGPLDPYLRGDGGGQA